MEKKGKLFVISAPSGAGKTTLVRRALEQFPQLSYSVSHTTRNPRNGEINGKDYFFINEKEFQTLVDQDQWIEWAKVHGNFYGTSRDFLEKKLIKGDSLLLDIDIQGAKQIMEAGFTLVSIFILPPSIEILQQRLENRGTDCRAVILQRMENALVEIDQQSVYDHVIVNDDIDQAIADLHLILENEMRFL
ncbi:MAG: guanylate kinase [Desulfobacteraceae bacterium]|nr:guanylate kinase [Desulfobacteraceae bacterium]